ncbi:MAG: hypothetical protein EOM37_09230 [Proteobacteria bacterium]|nr:hypothetical protein [Pseudomonadota bacterium]
MDHTLTSFTAKILAKAHCHFQSWQKQPWLVRCRRIRLPPSYRNRRYRGLRAFIQMCKAEPSIRVCW